MLKGLFGGIVVAFILDYLGFSGEVMRLVQPFVEPMLTLEHWYLFFGAVGLIGGAFRR